MVLPALMEAVAACARRRESVVVEGVHLSVEAALQLMHQHHPSCWVVPFLVYISNESKHLERFAVRARYMALTAAKNRYVHFFQNIRTIQADMGARADAARLPKIDNTNVDRSVAMIHDVTLAALREAAAGGSLVDRPGEAGELTAGPLLEKYEGCLLKWPWSSKRMIETLRERGALKGGGGGGGLRGGSPRGPRLRRGAPVPGIPRWPRRPPGGGGRRRLAAGLSAALQLPHLGEPVPGRGGDGRRGRQPGGGGRLLGGGRGGGRPGAASTRAARVGLTRPAGGRRHARLAQRSRRGKGTARREARGDPGPGRVMDFLKF